jgi:RNA polymerase sigma-70 factor (ECF subfamily)
MVDHDPFANPHELLRRVYAYVAYSVGNRVDAEDITSETFERALRYRHTFDSRKGEPIAWLLGIARNCVYDAMLQDRPKLTQPDPVAEADVEDQIVSRVTLEQALAALSAQDRELIALRYGSDLSPREIAKLLDRRTNAIDVALSRARGRLAVALEAASSSGGDSKDQGEVVARLSEYL